MNNQDPFLSNLGTVTRKNQVVTDPYLTKLGKVTIDNNYLPYYNLEKVSERISKHTSIKAPAGYLPANITIYHGSTRQCTVHLLFPQSISTTLSANFIKESPVGSVYPITAFSNVKEESIPLSFTIVKDYLPAGYSSVKGVVDDLRKMCIPSTSGNLILSPWVVVTYADISFSAICESMQVEYDTSIYGNKEFVKATINCTFTKINPNS